MREFQSYYRNKSFGRESQAMNLLLKQTECQKYNSQESKSREVEVVDVITGIEALIDDRAAYIDPLKTRFSDRAAAVISA